MSYGNVTVFAGPMFCGKTSHLLQQYIWKNHAKDYSLLIKPAFDDRYSMTEVVTHLGLKATAANITDAARIMDYFQNDQYRNLMIDECQFFTAPHVRGDIFPYLKLLLNRGVNIYASGLDMDWMGEPFEVTAKLLAMADNVHKLKSVCNYSGKEASKTYKKSLSGGSVELGETDKYEARNNEFWRYE
jgi:thymidine kinase